MKTVLALLSLCLVSLSSAAVFSDDTKGGWSYVADFGWCYQNSDGSPWIYHRYLGWIYTIEDGQGNFWFYTLAHDRSRLRAEGATVDDTGKWYWRGADFGTFLWFHERGSFYDTQKIFSGRMYDSPQFSYVLTFGSLTGINGQVAKIDKPTMPDVIKYYDLEEVAEKYAYELGYSDGYLFGVEEGRIEGESKGREEGLKSGTKEGYNAGYKEGYREAEEVYYNSYLSGGLSGGILQVGVGDWYIQPSLPWLVSYNKGFNQGSSAGYASTYQPAYDLAYKESYDGAYKSAYYDGFKAGYRAWIDEHPEVYIGIEPVKIEK